MSVTSSTAGLSHYASLLLRLTVGGLLIPHGVAKFLSFDKEIEAFGRVFGLQPANLWVVAIAVTQIACGLLIVSNRFARPAALVTAALMLGTIVVANHSTWFWHFKGAEYAVFWALCAVAVALDANTERVKV
jgi:putative oxidoreductase